MAKDAGCCPECKDVSSWGYSDEAHAMTCLKCGYSEVTGLREENARLQAVLGKLHPRVLKLSARGEPCIAIGCREPYFRAAYEMIRRQELSQGTWTQEDRDCMRIAMQVAHRWSLEAAEAADQKNGPDT